MTQLIPPPEYKTCKVCNKERHRLEFNSIGKTIYVLSDTCIECEDEKHYRHLDKLLKTSPNYRRYVQKMEQLMM
jgi:hypothetical protein